MSENVQNRLEEVEQTAQGPGRMLREARKVQQIDQEALATRLNLDLRIVDAIERDDFERMPPSTFIKGYLRAYAREVGLDADEVIAEYDRVAVQITPTLKSRHSVQKQADLNDSPMRWGSIGVIILVVALIGLWMFGDFLPKDEGADPVPEERVENPVSESVTQPAPPVEEYAQPGDDAATASSTAATDAPEQAEQLPADEAGSEEAQPEAAEATPTAEETTETASVEAATQMEEPAQAAVETAVVAEETPSADETTPASGDERASASAENEQSAASDGPVAQVSNTETAQAESESSEEANAPPAVDPEAPLVMTFSDDCWTSVQAADGERLVYRVVKKGAVLNIHGEAPFKITLGNSDVVKLVYQGKTFDHQPYSRGKIARFVLNADGSAQ